MSRIKLQQNKNKNVPIISVGFVYKIIELISKQKINRLANAFVVTMQKSLCKKKRSLIVLFCIESMARLLEVSVIQVLTHGGQ